MQMYEVTNSSKSYNKKELEALKIAVGSVVYLHRRHHHYPPHHHHHHHHHHIACNLGLPTCSGPTSSPELF
jgi:hypothetical protein